jgi:hypothetical protein
MRREVRVEDGFEYGFYLSRRYEQNGVYGIIGNPRIHPAEEGGEKTH